MTTRKPPRPPAGLGSAGRNIWRSVHQALPPVMEFDERDIAVLLLACRQADTVELLEKAIARDGAMIEGAAGQVRLNAAVTELRQSRVALAHLLGQLDLAKAAPSTASSQRASKAAKARWAADARKKRAREAAS